MSNRLTFLVCIGKFCAADDSSNFFTWSLCVFFWLQQKIKSTALVSACSVGALIAIGVYKNNDQFYDNVLMPVVRQCPPELCHRAAVVAFKYGLVPAQASEDAPSLVGFHFSFASEFVINDFVVYFLFYIAESEIVQPHAVQSGRNSGRL